MLIYAAADCHGRPERLRAVHRAVAAHGPDLVVLAGDITRHRQPDAFWQTLNQSGRPVVVVRGNRDASTHHRSIRPFAHLRLLHLATARINGVTILGISGTLPLPFHCRLGLREAPIETRAAGLLDAGAVLVVHAPPRGARDRVLGHLHAGSRAVRRLVTRCTPALVICGHIHEQAGIENIGATVVVNCALGRFSGGALIRYDGQSRPICRMLPPDR